MNMTKLHLPVLGSALVTLALFSAPAWSYDVDLAARYAQMFAPAKEKATGKELHCLKPEGFMNMIKKGEPLVGLDIRTPVEVSVFNLALPGSLSIPIDELFLPENLARIPKDRPVVVLCKWCCARAGSGLAWRWWPCASSTSSGSSPCRAGSRP